MRLSEAINELYADNHIGLYFVYVYDFEYIEKSSQDFTNEINLRRKLYPELDRNLVYIGKACGNGGLYKRLRQEFLQDGRGTFFRSVGAAIGETPRHAHNHGEITNYIFEGLSEDRIKCFIENAFSVCYINMDETPNEADDSGYIAEKKPILNIKHNPLPSQYIKEQRERCRRRELLIQAK